MITIELPFPDPHLLPNAARRLHWRVRAEYAKPARMIGKVETLNQIGGNNVYHWMNVALEIEFCEPDNKLRDLDGMLSALKPTLDGVAEAFEMDDRCFNPITLKRGAVRKGGAVILRIPSEGATIGQRKL